MIVPGSANSLLMAKTGDPLDELGKIDRALRTRAAAGGWLSRSFAAAAGVKWTWAGCVKRGQLAQVAGLFGGSAVYNNQCMVWFDSQDRLVVYWFNVSIQFYVGTSRVFRDTSAHYSICVDFDSTDPTPSERLKIWVDGVRETSFASPVWPALNAAPPIVTSVSAEISRYYDGTTYYADQTISYFSFVADKTVGPTPFGQKHPRTGQWRPRSKAAIRAAVAVGGGTRNGWGTNGFFLPFDDPTSLATLGYDKSQSDTDTTGNNWMANNISLTAGATYDFMLDTPTANYATLNPLIPASLNPAVLSNANLSAVFTATAQINAFLNMPLPKSGLWNWEVECVTGGTPVGIGIGLTSQPNAAGLLGDPNGYSYYNSTGQKYTGATASAYGSAWYGASRTDVITVLYDADARALSFKLNGVSQGVAFTLPAGVDWFPVGSHTSGTSTHTQNWNLGQRPLLYPVAGAKGLCTKNLPLPSISNPATAFVTVSDNGANVQATLTAARTGWPGYIDIIKRRDAAEGWRWIFSDDPANYLDSSGTAAKAVVPAFGGASYVGYSLKVSAGNGVATGRISHTNGVADVVTDGLAKNRKLIVLKSEAGGSWFVYHPDLTAGKLLYLEQTVAETTDASINTVTSSGFTIAAALPTGNYRWIALAESDGFMKLGKYVGNGSADGPFNAANSPALTITKLSQSGTSGWGVIDATRDKGNPSGSSMSFELTAGETSGTNYLDQLANGFKLRQSAFNANVAGTTQVFISIAALPFRYANAR